MRLALVDTNAPTVVACSVAPGRHAKGNTLYLSVAFSEPVTISGDIRKLATSWGDLAYVSGSGGNVLTFSGIIAGDASQSLNVTGLSLPKSEWWAISWFVDFEGDRAVVLVPTMFKEHIRMVIEQQLNRPVSGLFLSVGIEPYTVIDPETILTFFPMPPLVE